MYCSGCGSAMVQGMKFCNRCGTKIIDASEQTKAVVKTDKVIDHLATVICFVAIFGFIATFLIVENLVKSNANLGAIATFMLMLLATIFGISWLLVRQIAGVLDFNRQLKLSEESRSMLVRDTQPQQLEAPQQMISVTEETTRNFNPVAGRNSS